MFKYICIICCFFSYARPHAQEIISIADFIVDSIVFVEEEFLHTIEGTKGGWLPINYEQFNKIVTSVQTPPKHSCGGSAFNTIKALSKLGHHCTLIGAIGEDDLGRFFTHKLQEHGIRPVIHYSALPTACCVSLVTPDGHRTMRTFLGAAATIKHIELPASSFSQMQLFHIEGYQLQNQDLLSNAIAKAKANHAKISLDLASPELVSRQFESIYKLLSEKTVDVLFCNESEAYALTLLEAEKAVDQLSHFCDVVVITQAEKGCWIKSGNYKKHFPAIKTEVVDSTGAGDFFSAGFLHGYLQGATIEQSVRCGTYLASTIIQTAGTDLSDEQWEALITCIECCLSQK